MSATGDAKLTAVLATKGYSINVLGLLLLEVRVEINKDIFAAILASPEAKEIGQWSGLISAELFAIALYRWKNIGLTFEQIGALFYSGTNRFLSSKCHGINPCKILGYLLAQTKHPLTKLNPILELLGELAITQENFNETLRVAVTKKLLSDQEARDIQSLVVSTARIKHLVNLGTRERPLYPELPNYSPIVASRAVVDSSIQMERLLAPYSSLIRQFPRIEINAQRLMGYFDLIELPEGKINTLFQDASFIFELSKDINTPASFHTLCENIKDLAQISPEHYGQLINLNNQEIKNPTLAFYKEGVFYYVVFGSPQSLKPSPTATLRNIISTVDIVAQRRAKRDQDAKTETKSDNGASDVKDAKDTKDAKTESKGQTAQSNAAGALAAASSSATRTDTTTSSSLTPQQPTSGSATEVVRPAVVSQPNALARTDATKVAVMPQQQMQQQPVVSHNKVA